MLLQILIVVFLKMIQQAIYKLMRGKANKYSHAQNNYLNWPLANEKMEHNYKLVDNKPVELTEEENAIF
jgi:hypothetical protein